MERAPSAGEAPKAPPAPEAEALPSARETILRSLALGAATGLRSTGGWAILAASGAPPRGSPLRDERVRRGLLLALAGEAVADKALPLPARTDPLPLAGRALLGGAAAAVAASWGGSSRLGAALLAAATAVGTACLATSIRAACESRRVPDLLPALAEDLVVLGLGTAVYRLIPPPSRSGRPPPPSRPARSSPPPG